MTACVVMLLLLLLLLLGGGGDEAAKAGSMEGGSSQWGLSKTVNLRQQAAKVGEGGRRVWVE